MVDNKLEEYGEDENRDDEYSKIINEVEKIEPKEKEPKKNILKQIWNKTVFPDKIKNYKANKKMQREIQTEARAEAMKEVRPLLVKKYKEMELRKMTEEKKKKNWGQKLADGFSMKGSGMGDEKMRRLLGRGSDSGKSAGGSGINDEKMRRLLGTGSGSSKGVGGLSGKGGLGGLDPGRKIDMMLGGKKSAETKTKKKKSKKNETDEQEEPQKKERSVEDKIKDMLK